MPDLETDVPGLMSATADLEAALREATGDQPQAAAKRLQDSVIRPLGEITAMPEGDNDPSAAPSRPDPSIQSPAGDQQGPKGDRELPGRLRELARAATRLRVQSPDKPELAQAAAALQDLALTLADEDSAASLREELAALQSGLELQIQAARNGPYLVSNATDLGDWLGQSLPVRPQMALCRCGASDIKPLCDGTHCPERLHR